MKENPDKTALLARIAGTRATLGEDLGSLGAALDVPGRLRSSIRLHPVVWIAGAVALGFAASALFRGEGKGNGITRWRPMILGALGFLGNRLVTVSLPALQTMLEGEVSRWIERRRAVPTEKPASEA